MMHLMTSSKSRGTLGTSASCRDVTTTSCFPWRIPKPRIPAALRTLPSKLRNSKSLTSQPRQETLSTNGGSSFFGAIRRRFHPNRVEPFRNVGDDGDALSHKVTVSQSGGHVTGQFARLAVTAVGKRRPANGHSLRHQVYEQTQNCISHAFLLPGAVADDVILESSSAALTSKAALRTDSASSQRVSVDEAKRDLQQPKKEDGQINLGDRHPQPHKVDILINVNDIAPGYCVRLDEEEIVEAALSSGEIVVGSSPRETNEPKSPLENDMDEKGTLPSDEGNVVSSLPLDEDNDTEDDTLKDKVAYVDEDNEKEGATLSRDEGNVVSSLPLYEDDETEDDTCKDKVAYVDEDNEDEEIEFFDKTNEECDDDLDLDDLLNRCPKSSVIRHLQSAMELSKCVTRQMERALQKWSRISCGPFPKVPGRSLAKAELIDERTVALRTESARQLAEMNKMFFNFYCVTEELDAVENRQSWFVESIKERKAMAADEDLPKPGSLPKDRKSLAELYLDHRAEGRSEDHKIRALLGPRIPPTIEEED